MTIGLEASEYDLFLGEWNMNVGWPIKIPKLQITYLSKPNMIYSQRL